MSTATRDLFDRYHACWVDRDPDRIVALHTEDSIFHLHSGQEPARGREAIRQAAAGTFALVPDLVFHLVSLRIGEDFWVVQWQLRGTSATGNPVAVDLADYVLVEDGAVKEKHSYVDGVAMQAAVGAAVLDRSAPAR
ncbi:nuclear transport factor 2 family protein [Nocardia cyriacigeorgica]|uniref:nuclear transport factor 2 family protein n=1 Tax=Nocardia cyriacigeorgica TaxID=135487 RepID=UPI000CEA557B|nr:nuclear transport factor 2 family protein [Nocardia cyriacigeorgica]AVH25520.1 ketosteroid isomerase [Nocardia cyriacigeorgica]MBF6324147.1 nuclear transport factor 2 family protein [Nocardia cyriacigeorgica]PPJ07099.1 ketosteroid isomerase [Nocardia cyriacigeorgica]